MVEMPVSEPARPRGPPGLLQSKFIVTAGETGTLPPAQLGSLPSIMTLRGGRKMAGGGRFLSRKSPYLYPAFSRYSCFAVSSFFMYFLFFRIFYFSLY